jgi:hypothetical protein
VCRLAKNAVRLVLITQELGAGPMSNVIRQIMVLFDTAKRPSRASQILMGGSITAFDLPPVPGETASSIRPDLIYGRDRGVVVIHLLARLVQWLMRVRGAGAF